MNSNPWRSLNKLIQYKLSIFLVKIAPWLYDHNQSFKEWYKTYYDKPTGRKISKKSVYPEWYFNNALSTDERNSLLCVNAKMEKEGIWDKIKSLSWIGDTGNILFYPETNSKAFHTYLLNNGYGDWWFASSRSGCDWGVRSRFRGCQLHFLGLSTSGKVEGHLDINNPGDPETGEVTGALNELPGAIIHKIEDGWLRSCTHKPFKIREALLEQGIKVPAVK